MASVDDAMPGIIPETFGSARDAMRWYNEEREVLHQVCRLAVKLGDHRSALMLMLDWRPMSQAVNARRDMLPFAELAIQATEHVDELDLRAECFRDVAVVLTRTGQPDRARSYFDLAAQAFERAGNRLGQAQVYRSMALWLEVMSPEERIRLLGKAVAIARETGDQQILAVMLQGLAVGLKWGGRLEEALAVVDESAPLIAAVPGLAWLEPWVLSVRSMVLAGSGRLAESVDDGARALELYRHDGQLVNELNLMLSQGDGLTALGRFGEAAEVWRQFLARATSPELVRQGDPGTPYTDGAEIIAQVKAKLAALVDNGIQ